MKEELLNSCLVFFLLPRARSAGESQAYHLTLWFEGKRILTSEELAQYSGRKEFMGVSLDTFAVYF